MNDIDITGPNDLIKSIFEAAHEQGGLLQQMVPIDGEADRSSQVNAWGVKWDVDPENLEIDSVDNSTNRIVGTVDSPWGPPIQAFETFIENNPECSVNLKYWEPGMAFVGEFSSDTMMDEFYEYDLEDRTTIDDIPDELLEHFSIEEEFEQYNDNLELDYEDDD